MKTLMVVLAVAVAAFIVWKFWPGLQREQPGPVFDSGPIRVVRQRPGGSVRAPGAKLTEPEAVMTLRQRLAPKVKTECLAIASRGHEGDAYLFDAVDSCTRTKLGRWRVDGTTSEVKQYPAPHGG